MIQAFPHNSSFVFARNTLKTPETLCPCLKYMRGFSGILTSDKYAVYAAALDQSMRQACWTCEICNTEEEDSIRPGAGDGARRLVRDVRLFYHRSKRLLKWLPPPRRLRSSAEADMYDLLDRYRGSECEVTRRGVARL